MEEKKTSPQVKKVPNPTGVGGFKDHPENRLTRGWNPENSQKYLLNMFLHMTDKDFQVWGETHPKDQRTVAQVIAYEHVKKSRTTLNEYKEVTNRTEGMPKQVIEQSGELNLNINGMLDKIYGDPEPDSTT